MASIADVYVTVLPETSQLKEGVRKAFRDSDSDAREAGRRWGREIRSGMGDVGVKVDGDIEPARRKVEQFTKAPHRTSVKVDVDKGSMNAAAAALRAVSTNLTATAVGAGAVLSPTAIAATGTAVAQLSGVIGLLPGVIGTAGLAFGSLKVATLGFADAMKEVRDPEKFGEALKQISPNMQEAARAIQGILPQIDTLKFTVQDAFGAGMGQQIQALSATYLPMFQTVMSQMAASANNALTQVSGLLQTPALQGQIQQMTANSASAFDALSQALAPVVNAFTQIGLVGSGFLPQLAQGAAGAAQAFSDFIAKASATGDLQGWIQTGIDAFKQLGDIVMNVGGIITGIMKAAPDGGGLLGTLQSITQVASDFINSPAGQGALNSWMTAVQGAMSALAPAAGALLQALAPLAGLIGTTLSGAIQAIAPALTTWFTAMQPVIDQLSAALAPVLQQITPVLGQLAMMLATQMVAGIQQILPVLVPFVGQMGQLLVAVMPLLPPLMQLALTAMPVFQSVLTTILPVLTTFASLLTEQANVVVPLLSSQMTMLSGVFTAQWGAISGAVSTAVNLIGPLLDALSAKIQQILDGPIGKILGALSGPLPRAIASITGNLPSGGVPASTPAAGVPLPMAGQPALGGLPGAQAARRGAAPVAPAMNIPMTTLPVPAVSTYIAPPPAAKKSGSGGASGSSATTYGYTGDAALLANVPAGKYTQTQGADLTQGLADCSSAVEDLVNLMDGRSTSGRSMATGNAAEWLPAHGFLPGTMPGAFNVGFNDHHMQATLPGGTNFNWGSDAAAARGGVGGTGAFDPAFTQHYYRPVLEDAPGVSSVSGGGSPVDSAYPTTEFTPTGDPTFDRKGRDAQQKVADKADAITRAQMKYNQVMANGKSTALQRAKAEQELAKAKREHADAQTDLNTLLTEGNKAESKGDTGGGQLGQDILSGMGEVFGLGTLFKDPTQFGLFKIFKAAMGLKLKDDTGSTDSGGGLFPQSGGGGGGPLGILSSLIPQPFGNLKSGSPGDAPGQFMPAMPNSGGGGIVAPGGILADPNSPPGAPGPGNGSYNDFRGANFGYSQTGVKDQVNSAHLQQVRQPLRSLPS